MDSWTFNKIAGAVLGTGLLVLALQNVSGILFHHEGPSEEKPGFMIEAAEAATPSAAGAAPAAAVSLGTLLATADATKGAGIAKACASCHYFEKGKGKKNGPELYGVVGRPIGSMAGIEYSAGFKEKASEKWTYENLSTFLIAPKAYIKGTKMSYGGLKNDKKRADLLAYLASLSDAPVAFPAP